MAATQIAPFRPELTGAFKALNEAWITALFALEPNDSVNQPFSARSG
jgi:hypothetical protein